MITFRNGAETVGVFLIPTGPNKTDWAAPVYVDVTSWVLDHTDVRGKMEPLAIGRRCTGRGVTLVKGVPR
jgi:hypothetical protein